MAMMKVEIMKSFPWYRDAYKAGSFAEIDEVIGKQWINAGLARATVRVTKVADTRKPQMTAKTPTKETAPVTGGVVSADSGKLVGEAGTETLELAKDSPAKESKPAPKAAPKASAATKT